MDGIGVFVRGAGDGPWDGFHSSEDVRGVNNLKLYETVYNEPL